MTEWLAFGCLAVGLLFVAVGTVGFVRFADVYLRLQASSKALTFGFGFLILGAGLASGDGVTLAKAAVAALFQFLTAPIAAHMIARTALSRGVRPAKLEPPRR